MFGRTLAHYEIVELLGKGGMGEVYRARDAKLGRDVAVKILPEELSRDAERVARFEREARTLASLQHANIASIYGFEQVDDVRFLVMELVEGEDLAERLRRGPIAVDEAIDIARQIAEGLEAAHAQDIVHRDLKPANVKITPTRDVKILDFGLARAYASDVDAESTLLANSPTITAGMTQAGVILGTAAYMSPEQARGQAVDKQSDIWSFGVVLYEMLTGECPFAGATASDSIGAILHREPDLDHLPSGPPQIHTLLRRLLVRDKRDRLRDIGDARIELDEARFGTASITAAAPEAGGRTGWFVALALAAVVAVLGTMVFTGGEDRTLSRTTLGLPTEQAINLTGGTAWSSLQFAPDGQSVLYVGGRWGALYLRDLDSFESTRLPDTDGALLPAFSPDGRWIAYFANSKVWKIAVSGGAPVEICDAGLGPGLAWGQGELYFCRTNGGGLWAVSENGGEPRPISQLNDERDETSHRWPQVLPDGRHLLMTIKTARIETFDDASIGILSLDTGDVTVLLEGGANPRYVETGHIVYGRNFQLFAVPFDAQELTVLGTPVPLVDGIHTSDLTGSTHCAVSSQGHLAYVPTIEDYWDFGLVWLHLTGKITPLEVDLPRAFDPAVSPSGDRFAAVVPAANDKVWLQDLTRGTSSRITNTPGNDRNPVWSPDGTTIVFINDRDGSQDIFSVPVDGGAPAREILESDDDDMPSSWSPDGSTLLFTRIKRDGDSDIWLLDMRRDGGAQPWLQTPSVERAAQFSPNGRWVAYAAAPSGELEVFVRPYPGPAASVRISTSGGRSPEWSRDGKTLFFRAGGSLMAASIDFEGGLRADEPVELVELGEAFTGTAAKYSASPDGGRLLAGRYNLDARQHQIRVILGWTQELKQRSERD